MYDGNPGGMTIGGGGVDLTTVTSHILPSADLTYDLGSTSSQWRSLYVGTSTIYLGGTPVSVAGGSLTVGGSPVGSGGSTATVVALTNGMQNVYIPNPDEVEVPIGTVYEFSVIPFSGALDTQRDIIIRFENSVTYDPYFSGTLIFNKSDTGDQIQSIVPNTYFSWTMYTGTPGTTGIISGQAKIVYCGTGTWNIAGNDISGHFYTVSANTDLSVFGGG
jgi:hypothetical protein